MTPERLLWGIPEISRYLKRGRSATRLLIDQGALKVRILDGRVVARVSDAMSLVADGDGLADLRRWEGEGGAII